MADHELLKKDLFGEIRSCAGADGRHLVRDAGAARAWVRWLARALMRREARALATLQGLDGVPQIVRLERSRLVRDYLPGRPLYRAKPTDREYFRAAMRLLRRMHRHGVVHNDLAKEPNILVRDDGRPAFVDFQLAFVAPRRGKLFRVLAWDDIRHLLKHKRSYCREHLTRRESEILARPSAPSRLFRSVVKPAYLFVTRRLFRWADREGAADRGART